jgi:hypothetical protein
MVYTGPIDILRVRSGLQKATATDKGPNGARRVVWALGVFFFINIRVFNTN